MSVPLVERSIFFGVYVWPLQVVTSWARHQVVLQGGWRGGAGPEPGGGASGSFQALCQPPDNCQQWERGSRGWQNLSLTDRWAPSHHCGIVAGRRAGKLKCMWGGEQPGESGWGRQAETDNEGRESWRTNRKARARVTEIWAKEKKKHTDSLSKTGGEEPETEREPQTQKETKRANSVSEHHHIISLGSCLGFSERSEAPEPTVYMWGGENRRKPPNLLHFLLGPHCWQLRWWKEFNASHQLALHSGFVPSLPGPGRGSDW